MEPSLSEAGGSGGMARKGKSRQGLLSNSELRVGSPTVLLYSQVTVGKTVFYLFQNDREKLLNYFYHKETINV